VPAGPAEPPDLALPEVLVEQQSHLKAFVGREGLLRATADWLDEATQGGYLLLLGPPGQGKSALMAELARREAERGGCLLHMVKSHAQPLRFVPALISQAARLARTALGPEPYRGDLDDLRNHLLEALELLHARTGRAVVVLDALDELEPGGDRLRFLPPRLPAGARVVLTCRPDIPLVEALRARLRGNLTEREVPPLGLEDFLRLLERKLGAEAVRGLARSVDFEALFERLGGNALFLSVFADDLGERWAEAARAGRPLRVSPDEVPATLEAVFRQVYDRVRGKKDGQPLSPEGRQRARLLQLLCVAREALPIEALSGLMAAWGEPLFLDECRDRLEEMSQWLLAPSPGCFKPWHQGLADHVRGRALGEPGVRQAEEVFCRWLEGGEAGRYGLRHRARHLLGAGRSGEAFRLLTDLRELEARAEAGLVFALVNDLAELNRALAEGEERRLLGLLEEGLRRDVHFIDRHQRDYPQALFQCLWNTCWWYDCAEAAAHYDLSQRTGSGPLPWQREGRLLSELMERWRREKEGREPGLVWLRSLRPPSVHLGTAQQAVLIGHDHSVRSVSFSPDGTRIVSGSFDNTVRVWDAQSGAELLRLRGHGDRVTEVRYSPDGTRIVSGAYDRTVRVWDALSGAELLCLYGHEGRVSCVNYSPDGTRVVSGGADCVLRVWDAQSGAELLCLRGHDGWVTGVCFSPDGTRIVSGGADRTVRAWDAQSGAELLCLAGHKGWVTGVGYSPDGTRLLSGGADATVRVWDADSGAQLLRLRGHDGWVTSVSYAPDGTRIASGSLDRTVRAWGSLSGDEMLCLRGHDGWVASVSYSPDGSRIVSGAHDNTVRVWDGLRGAECLWLRGHDRNVSSVSCSPDGSRVISGSHDETVRAWDAATAAELLCLRGHGGIISSTSCSPDGSRVVSGAHDRTVRVWDVATGAELLCLRGHDGIVSSVGYAPDGTRLVSGSWDATVRVWDGVSGAELLCLRGHDDRVTGVLYSRDGTTIVSESEDNTVRVWDAASGACLRVLQGQGGAWDVAGVPRCPWRAVPQSLDTVIQDAASGLPVAWLPSRLTTVCGCLSGRSWAGGSDRYLGLFTLEGAPPSPGRGP
jgi:WD40 repeat protein